jgi:CheY-like chemotaxis protein/signal transduction histidine kinase
MLGFFRSLLTWPKPDALTQRMLGGVMLAIAICLPLPLGLNATNATLLIMLSGCLTLALLCVTTYLHWHDGGTPLRFAAAALATSALFSASGIGFFYSVPPFTWLNQTYWLVAGTLLATVFLSLALTARQLMQLRENILAMRQRAERRSEIKAKTAFLARISHDIRSPLNGVLGMAELLLATPLSNKQRDFAQTIRRAGNELLTLLGQILDVSRLESGMIELENAQFDYPALLDDCLDMFRSLAEQQGIELINQIKPDVPQRLFSDPARVRQIILSLLENAFRHSPAGEILLVSETDNSKPQPRMRLRVHDYGTSLSASEREQVLHAELHGRDFLDADYHSGRLPLVIARQLVRMMGGDFGVEASPSSGNCLWICLPIQTGEAQEAEQDLPAAELQGVRILVVDDNQTCRKVLSEQCQSWGMLVSEAASGIEALALLRSKTNLGQAFDVVLLDQRMPGMSGMQLAAKIKTDSALNNDILLIMLSGISDAPGKLAIRNAGIRRILAKPVAGYTLHSTLRSELGRRSSDVPRDHIERAKALNALRVLIADDDTISVKVITAMLLKMDVQPDIVSNGAQALRAMQTHAYDLVLMDCEMPVMDGFSATEKMRAWEQLEQRPRTPIVALTAHILTQHKEHAKDSGMDEHIGKPLELSQLREVIERWTAEKPVRDDEFHDTAHDAAQPPH